MILRTILRCFTGLLLLVISSSGSLNAQEFMGGDVRFERLSPVQCSVYVDIYYKAVYSGPSDPPVPIVFDPPIPGI